MNGMQKSSLIRSWPVARAMAAGAAIPAPDDVAAPPADAERTASGLASKVLKAGSGACSGAFRFAQMMP